MEIKPSLLFWVTLIHLICIYGISKAEERFFFTPKTPLKIVHTKYIPKVLKSEINNAPINHAVNNIVQEKVGTIKKEATSKKMGLTSSNKKVFVKKKSLPSSKIVQDLEQSIASLTSFSKKESFKKRVVEKPKTISLSLDEFEFSSENSSFRDLIVEELKEKLSLPEYGEVKLTISIDKEGSVNKITILSSKSVANQVYLKKELKNMKFNYLPKTKHEFTISFKNEI